MFQKNIIKISDKSSSDFPLSLLRYLVAAFTLITIMTDFLDTEVVDSLPLKYEDVKIANCDGSIDLVNGVSPTTQNLITSNLLSVEGWLAVSAKDGLAPDDIFVTLYNPNGTTDYIETHRIPRQDVKAYYSQPEMPDVGFNTIIDLGTLNGEYMLGLARGHDGALEQCIEFNILLNIAGEK